ncbi:glycosyltransferase family 2 protein [Glacieibacterium megasporae]|uniref:glycosyltransferase family 2 protein n=1 Tax=Glacieibacterium megasporae TaxID=2835787 RepID=UPI001C1DEC3C|nr:glycosyltransferase family 2 protein [Polymorphobacter megasporae]UAJ09910.1 glycosyltransferase family 2 protein [Polymorphobacter megasporae]
MTLHSLTTQRQTTRPAPDLGSPLALAVIVPTLNEAGNIAAMVAGLDRALDGLAWEAIFVDDDSTDGTAALLRQIGAYDRRIRVIQRLGRRGLASAVTEGVLATAAPVIAVIDGDMQHDEVLLPKMYEAVTGDDGGGGCDLAIGSRYVDGGAASGFTGVRELISRTATRVTNATLRTTIADPMSGFFAVRHDAFMASAPHLSNIGFKILMDVVASSPAPLAIREIPYTFRPRHAGTSKLDPRVAHEFFVLLLEKMLGRYVPVRFLMFAGAGLFGLAINLMVIGSLFRHAGISFAVALPAGVIAAMAFNYLLANTLTYRDLRLRGAAFLRGFVGYAAVCAPGAIGNIFVSTLLFRDGSTWWVAALAGAVIAVTWTYAATLLLTAKRRRPA